LVVAWVWIFATPDAFGLNTLLAMWAFGFAIVFWVVGAAMIAGLAWVARRRRSP